MSRSVVEFRRAGPADLQALLLDMRPADVDEVIAMTGQAPADVLHLCLEQTRHPVAAYVDGHLACMYGVTDHSMLTGEGAPWMLSTHVLDSMNAQKALLRFSKRLVSLWMRQYRYLHNFVDARHEASIRWLRWMGFVLSEPEPFGPFGMPFHHFEMRR